MTHGRKWIDEKKTWLFLDKQEYLYNRIKNGPYHTEYENMLFSFILSL